MDWLMITEALDWTALPRAILGSIFAHRSISPATLAGLNDWPFFMPAGYGFQAASVLEGWGIDTWGHSSANGEDFFRVRKEEAGQAEQILISVGIPLYHRSALGGELSQPDELPDLDAKLDAELEEMDSWLRL